MTGLSVFAHAERNSAHSQGGDISLKHPDTKLRLQSCSPDERSFYSTTVLFYHSFLKEQPNIPPEVDFLFLNNLLDVISSHWRFVSPLVRHTRSLYGVVK